jgi:hypothetical protein
MIGRSSAEVYFRRILSITRVASAARCSVDFFVYAIDINVIVAYILLSSDCQLT